MGGETAPSPPLGAGWVRLGFPNGPSLYLKIRRGAIRSREGRDYRVESSSPDFPRFSPIGEGSVSPSWPGRAGGSSFNVFSYRELWYELPQIPSTLSIERVEEVSSRAEGEASLPARPVRSDEFSLRRAGFERTGWTIRTLSEHSEPNGEDGTACCPVTGSQSATCTDCRNTESSSA